MCSDSSERARSVSGATLFIDTSTPRAVVGITWGTPECFSFRVGTAEQSHYEELPELVRAVRGDAPSDARLECIVLGQGPGSFTGLRIGYSYVLGLALPQAVPVRQVCSLAAIALPVWQQHGGTKRVIVTLPAGRGEMFMGGLAAGAMVPGTAPVLPAQIVGPQQIELERGQSVLLDASSALDTQNGELLARGLRAAAAAGLGHEGIFNGTGVFSVGLAPNEAPRSNGGGADGSNSPFSPAYVRPVAARTIVERTRT